MQDWAISAKSPPFIRTRDFDSGGKLYRAAALIAGSVLRADGLRAARRQKVCYIDKGEDNVSWFFCEYGEIVDIM